jgi:hypothetical protein
MEGAGLTDLTFDLSRALARWSQNDFYELLESELQADHNTPAFRFCLGRICQHQGKVENVSDVITHSAYDMNNEIWAIIRMDVVESYTNAGGESQLSERQRGVLSLSINKETGKATITGCCYTQED